MGGAENQVVALADTFARQGHSVCIVALTGDLIVLPTVQAIQVVGIGMQKNPLSFLAAYARLRSTLANFRPDVVHSHMVHANLLARLVRLTLPMNRLICTAHSSNEGGMLRMLAYRMTDALADLTTNVSTDGLRRFIELKAVSRTKGRAIHNGIDCNRFSFSNQGRARIRSELGIEEDAHVFLNVARIVPEKDHSNLLQAFAIVRQHAPMARLLIVGDGPELQAMTILAHELEVAEHVQFLGVRRDVPDLLAACDTFVLSSYIEGLPLVIGEAMACERYVVTTDAGGVREFVGDNGTVVPIQDRTALAEAMRSQIFADIERRQLAGKTGRSRIQATYSLESIAEGWSHIYLGMQPNDDGTTLAALG